MSPSAVDIGIPVVRADVADDPEVFRKCLTSARKPGAHSSLRRADLGCHLDNGETRYVVEDESSALIHGKQAQSIRDVEMRDIRTCNLGRSTELHQMLPPLPPP